MPHPPSIINQPRVPPPKLPFQPARLLPLRPARPQQPRNVAAEELRDYGRRPKLRNIGGDGEEGGRGADQTDRDSVLAEGGGFEGHSMPRWRGLLAG